MPPAVKHPSSQVRQYAPEAPLNEVVWSMTFLRFSPVMSQLFFTTASKPYARANVASYVRPANGFIIAPSYRTTRRPSEKSERKAEARKIGALATSSYSLRHTISYEL
jgi:hypothetical protein